MYVNKKVFIIFVFIAVVEARRLFNQTCHLRAGVAKRELLGIR
jgi:hypothetical protein